MCPVIFCWDSIEREWDLGSKQSPYRRAKKTSVENKQGPAHEAAQHCAHCDRFLGTEWGGVSTEDEGTQAALRCMDFDGFLETEWAGVSAEDEGTQKAAQSCMYFGSFLEVKRAEICGENEGT
jgi:hypothetical protein